MLHHASIGVACAQGHIRHHDMQIHAAIGLNLKNVRFLVSVHEANSLGDASKKNQGQEAVHRHAWLFRRFSTKHGETPEFESFPTIDVTTEHILLWRGSWHHLCSIEVVRINFRSVC